MYTYKYMIIYKYIDKYIIINISFPFLILISYIYPYPFNFRNFKLPISYIKLDQHIRSMILTFKPIILCDHFDQLYLSNYYFHSFSSILKWDYYLLNLMKKENLKSPPQIKLFYSYSFIFISFYFPFLILLIFFV